MSNEREPTTGEDLASQWERLANELRACKESQRRTWGDLDDATLGRYLAGEASGEETARVECEMHDRPELRKLTDLVRDVLGELDPIETAPRPAPAPRLLKFEKPRAQRRQVYEWVRRRSSLVAAACLLIVLGVAMPNPGFLSAPLGEDPGVAPQPALAARGVARGNDVHDDVMRAMALPEAAPAALAPAPAPASRTVSPPAPRLAKSPRPNIGSQTGWTHSRSMVKADRSAPAARRNVDLERVVALQREGNELRKRGDYLAAQGKLAESYLFCKDKLGEQHQATKNSACSLADVYVVGLTPPAQTMDMKVVRGQGDAQAMAASDTVQQASVMLSANPVPAPAPEVLPTRLDSLPVRKIKDQVVPVLTAAFENAPTVEKRRLYLLALGELGSVAGAAVPALTQRLEGHADASEVMAVLGVLKQMGPAADSALPVVVKLREEAAKAKDRMFTERQMIEIGRVAYQLKGSAGRVGVRDRAGCFTFGVLRQSCRQLSQLAQNQGVEVFVETFTKEPADPARALERMGPRAVYLAIDPKTPAVTVSLSDQLKKNGFDADGLRRQTLAAFRDHKFDQGLVESVKTIKAGATGK
jgi:hypothetical protein